MSNTNIVKSSTKDLASNKEVRSFIRFENYDDINGALISEMRCNVAAIGACSSNFHLIYGLCLKIEIMN